MTIHPSNANRLLQSVDRIDTFAEVAQWDHEASAEVYRIQQHLESLSGVVDSVAASRTAVSLFSQPLEALRLSLSLRRARRTLRASQAVLAPLAELLQTAIDKTPNSKGEQKEMLKELRLAKKEFAIQKREINAHMTAVRVNARQESADVGQGLGLFLSNAATRRLERMSIRLGKEAALAPGENAKAAIERKIMVVDRAILWVERFR